MKKIPSLNILTQCRNLCDFSESDSYDDSKKVRSMQICFSWRHFVFVKGFIGNNLVFFGCSKVKDHNALRDIFNMCRYGHFIKSAGDTAVSEAMHLIGFDDRDLAYTSCFTISDLNAEYPVIDGCFVLDFHDSNVHLTAEHFSFLIPKLFDNLVRFCRDYESARDVVSELESCSDEIAALDSQIADSSDDATKCTVLYERKNKIVSDLQLKSYLVLSEYGFVRDAYYNALCA